MSIRQRSQQFLSGMNFQNFRALKVTARLFLVLAFTAAQASAARLHLSDTDYVSVPLIGGKENKLLVNAQTSGGKVRMELDTGAPITCVEQSKATLFGLVSSSTDSTSPMTVMLNGLRHRIAIIPALRFGTVETRNIPAALINLRELSGAPRSRHERPNDAILGLDALQSTHAVIDCGSRRLLLNTQSGGEDPWERSLKAFGWREIPMRLQDEHLVVSAFVNHKETGFIVDTGSPVSAMDLRFCRHQRITLSDRMFSMNAIHFQAKAVKVGKIKDLKIGGAALGKTLVAVFDVSTFLKRSGKPDEDFPCGLLGAETLMRGRAFIDCGRMKLYLKPLDGGGWQF